jgi:c-di-GMP-binding flagellar brake protein YcgR
MNVNKKQNERRQYERHKLSSDVIVLLQSENVELLGTLEDISLGGMRMKHIDDNETSLPSPEVEIDFLVDEPGDHGYLGKNIWNMHQKSEFSVSNVDMKQRGVKFKKLSKIQIEQLNEFIVQYTLA